MKNREIKFRGYDPYGKYDETLNRNVGAWMHPVSLYRNGVGCTIIPTYGDRFTWQQYTGLNDRNGREIYEGDIINTPLLGDWFDLEVKRHNQIVYYYTSKEDISREAGFVCALKRAIDAGYSGSPIPKDCEVVGNIFDTPDLVN